MKILTFVDVHTNKLALAELGRKAKDADLLICAGDMSVFGSGLEETLEVMNSWNKPVLVIHGNHEDEDELFEMLKQFSNLHWIHGAEADIGGLSIVGWGGGGFAHEDPVLAAFAAQLVPKDNRILVFHGPPYNTTVDSPPGWGEHVGCRTRRAVIERLQPALSISGHIHETFGAQDKIGRTIVLNPGPLGIMINLGEGTEKKATPEKKKETKSAKKSPAKKTAKGKRTS